jgi:hypothetical protein
MGNKRIQLVAYREKSGHPIHGFVISDPKAFQIRPATDMNL